MMQALYRKDDCGIMMFGDSFAGIGEGFGAVEIGDASALLDAEGQLLPGKTLADIPGAAERLKAAARSRLDAKTGADILAGFDHRGVRFKLTPEDQINFANAYVCRDKLSYPLTVKGAGLVFLELADTVEVEAFYLVGVAFVQGRLAQGWADKQSLDSLSLAELAAYEVPG